VLPGRMTIGAPLAADPPASAAPVIANSTPVDAESPTAPGRRVSPAPRQSHASHAHEARPAIRPWRTVTRSHPAAHASASRPRVTISRPTYRTAYFSTRPRPLHYNLYQRLDPAF
jgi:hypothetical protein